MFTLLRTKVSYKLLVSLFFNHRKRVTGMKPDLKNYYRLPVGTTIHNSLPKTTTEYIVFNSSKNRIIHSALNNMSKDRALAYIHSTITGKFHKAPTFAEKCAMIQRNHLVSITTTMLNGILVYVINCDCKGFRKCDECSHEAATEVILGIFNIEEFLAKICKGNVKGRPKKSTPVGFFAHKPVHKKNEVTDNEARNLVLSLVVQFWEPPFAQMPFVGKIVGEYQINAYRAINN